MLATVSVNSKLCTYNEELPPELRPYILSACPLQHLELPPNHECHCEGASVYYDPPGEPPLKFAGCTFPRDRAGRMLEIKPAPVQKLKPEKIDRKATDDTSGQRRMFGDIDDTTAQQSKDEIAMTAETAPAAPTAVAAPPAPLAAAAPAGAIPPLWPRGMQIPFIGVTGEFGVGKTLFGLFIDPPRCVHFDFEKSAQTYQSGLPFTRIDMQDKAREKYPNGRYRPQDLFLVWRDLFLSLPKGRYRVAVIDDVSTLEDGIAEYVRSHPAEFGYTAAQFQKSEAMVWGAVKAYYKQLMLGAGIECCVMVAHMRAQFSGNRPTGKREAKGKETVMELASLYLMLDRKPDEKGRVPAKPNAVKLKDRLSVFIQDEKTGEYTACPALPPRITNCDPGRIRWYIDNPPDYSKLKKDELAVAEQLTEDEKLMIQSQIAADQKEAAQAQAVNQVQVNEAARIRLQAMEMSGSARSADQSANVVQAVEQRTADQAQQANDTASQAVANDGQQETPAEAPKAINAGCEAPVGQSASLDTTDAPAVPMATSEQLDQMRSYKQQLAIPDDAWKGIVAKRGVQSAKQLTEKQADELLAALERRRQSTTTSNALDQWANNAVGITTPAAQSAQQPPFDVPATQPA